MASHLSPRGILTDVPIAATRRESRWKRWLPRVLAGLALLSLALMGWWGIRRAMRPAVPLATAAQEEQAKRVRILRDRWGVAHVFGETDADTAFGLAYSNAEDDWPLIELILIATRGELARKLLSEEAVVNDYFVQLLDVAGQTERHYESRLAPETRVMLEGYAQGLNYYAALHPSEVDSRFLPFSGRDVAAGFAHKLPLMSKVDRALKAIKGDTPLSVGDQVQWAARGPEDTAGSNAHAVAPSRTADGVTFLNVNSHQPWEGPVSWHEVHLVSGEGWNMTGGLFPGSPVVLHGHNQHLGWAHTFNRPDQVDVYRLTTDSEHPGKYLLDGSWRDLQRRRGAVRVDLGLFEWTWELDLLESDHGLVIETDHGHYAVRFAGQDGRFLGAVEQWYRMNKATSLEEWREAMRLQAIPLFHTVYADRENIHYVYNALLPERKDDDRSIDWLAVLPGDRSDLIWDDGRYLAYDELPSVTNPPAGWLQNCNSTPWRTTSGEGNPDREQFSWAWGISTRMSNRAVRSHEMFGADESITREEFLRYKFDRAYSRKGPIWPEALKPVLDTFEPVTDHESQALELLRGWDGECDEASTAAALAILTYRPAWAALNLHQKGVVPDPLISFREAVAFLVEHHGRVDVPLGEVQRLRRGDVDLPLGGGPDVLNAAHGYEDDAGHIVGVAGDSYVLVVEFGDDGPRSWAVQPYGNVNRPESPHFADQAPLFVNRELRQSLRTEEQIRAELEADYHPGQEPSP